MSLEGVWLQLVIQAKKILTEWNVGAVDKQCESENAWCNGHSTNNRPITKIAKTNVLPPSLLQMFQTKIVLAMIV